MSDTETGSIPPPPSSIPQPTGNVVTDVFNSVKHVTDIPCARNSLLGGIASGFGIGVIRGISSTPIVAGNWAIATFAVISLGTFHLCQRQMDNERKKITSIIESMPKRTIKQGSDTPSTPDSSTNSISPSTP